MGLHPVLSISGSVVISSIVVGCTPPHRHAIRSGALLLIALCTWQCTTTAKARLVRNPWAQMVAGHSVTLLFHYIDIAVLNKWSFSQLSLRQQLVSGFSLTLNPRFIGTSQQVKHVPRPVLNQSRKSFLWSTGGLILLSYLVLDVLDSNLDVDLTAKYMSASNVPVLRRLYRHELSLQEVIVRVFSVVGLVIGLVAVQGGCYLLFAFVRVLCHLSSPADWPPLFGSISDAYTLRRVWSHVWHQLNTHKLNCFSRYLVHGILLIPQGTRSILVGYARLGVCFVLSGLVHALMDTSIGLTMSTSGGLAFFCTQILGIVVEDAVLSVYSRLTATKLSHLPSRPSAAQKVIGFVWVCAFLVWTLPAYMYPMISLNSHGGNDSVLPVSLVGLWKRR
ncbi:membrane bound O-acyl transferase family-domain-containing protein [Aspergillus carlsbadensis]|nr:membrane bound O-acyl transferase family-domain-containing protein [Aspergillus carlsbadensis]